MANPIGQLIIKVGDVQCNNQKGSIIKKGGRGAVILFKIVFSPNPRLAKMDPPFSIIAKNYNKKKGGVANTFFLCVRL